MDLSQSIVPKSDQLNADDLMGSPRTYTITDVTPGNAEQPVNVELADARPFRPSKSMLRVMVAAWGLDGKEWVGHRLTLYRDPKVKFGGVEVGGIRISYMTGLDGPLKLALTETRGKRGIYVVKPLADATPPEAAAVPEDVTTPSSPGSITKPQLGKLHTMLTKVGITDRDEGLGYYQSVVDREVESSKSLSKNEAKQIIDALELVAAADKDSGEVPS